MTMVTTKIGHLVTRARQLEKDIEDYKNGICTLRGERPNTFNLDSAKLDDRMPVKVLVEKYQLLLNEYSNFMSSDVDIEQPSVDLLDV